MLNLLRKAFTKKQPTAAWVAPLLRYLALRREEDFQQALVLASEQVVKFLLSYAREDADSLEQSCEPLVGSLGGTTPEALTIRLLRADVWARLVETWRRYPSERMFAARDDGMKA